LIYYYIIITNIIGFLIMNIDKKRAVNKKWRIKESTLILISLIGGSVGMLFGMKIFHHKTKKKLFSVGVPLILVLQITAAALILLLKFNIL